MASIIGSFARAQMPEQRGPRQKTIIQTQTATR
jgi:hypothetical protein